MSPQRFTSGRIRQVDYDASSQQLDITWDNRTVTAYKHVPQEVFRRLCSAPNPATYWEDRIAEEYPKATPSARAAAPDAAREFRDLFGGGEG